MTKAQVAAVLVVLATVLAGTAAYAQTPWTGTPAFSTQLVSETDQVNPANLNVHLRIPIFMKKGRKLDLTYILTYDSLVWVRAKGGPPRTPPRAIISSMTLPRSMASPSTIPWVGW
jgi:hypothetical protein